MIAGAALLGMACTGSVLGGGSSPGGPPAGNGNGNGNGNTPPGTGNGGQMGTTPVPNGPPIPVPPVSAENSAGSAVFRRLTLVEYKNTLRDLVGITLAPADLDLPGDSPNDTGFGTGAPFVTATDADKAYGVTDKLATQLAGKLVDLVPKTCNLAATAVGDQESCAREFIDKFGIRAFRRPLNDDEKQDLFDLFKQLTAAPASATFPEAMLGLTRAMLQSPQFFYRWELGVPATRDGALVKYNPYEMASRLSYFLWASMPDTQLLDAAGAGKLSDPNDIANQARRMLSDKKALDAIADFHVHWLDVEGIQGLQKDESFTKWDPAVAQAMRDEVVSFSTNLFKGDKANFSDLMTSTSTFLNEGLAKVYGVTGVTGTALQPAKLDGSQRAGVMTMAGFMAAHSDEDYTHPVRRGVITLRHIMCNQIPEPQGLTIPLLPPRSATETNRQHFEQHEKAGGACAGCHNFIDPVGFAFENYDAIGAWQDTDANQKVDASGTVSVGTKSITFKNAVDFAKQLAETKEVRECVGRRWMRYVLRRSEAPEEQGSVDSLMKVFEQSQWDMREMLVALTTTPSFTHRKLIAGEATK